MKVPYQNELYELRKWIDNTNENMSLQLQFFHTQQEFQMVKQLITSIAEGIQGEYPFYADILPQIASILFPVNNMGAATLNPAAFGELVVIIRHISAEPFSMRFWPAIHTRIKNVSYELYEDGYYAAAAEKAVKEVETRLREKFIELKPNVAVPSKVGDIIGALLSENGAFKFCDASTISGRDYRRGIQSLFEGTMAAYRNPSAHANLPYDRREAMEQIILASQLMSVLDRQIENESEMSICHIL